MQDRIKSSQNDNSSDDFEIPKPRNRSKSSSAIFRSFDDGFSMQQQIPDFSSIWQQDASLLHRRSSTQPPGQNLVWEALKASQLATVEDMNGDNIEKMMDQFKQSQYTSPRRFSVAPSMVTKFMTNIDQSPEYDFTKRRHSIGFLDNNLEDPVDGLTLNKLDLNASMTASNTLKNSGSSDDDSLEKIEDYFENTVSRQKAFKDANKNLQQAGANVSFEASVLDNEPKSTHPWPLYVIEFKAGRTDYFYLPAESSNLKIQIGDLLIVEADRGQDLGKVIEMNITSSKQLQLYQQTHVDPLVDSHNAVGKQIVPKKIYRKAEKSEPQMLLLKSTDELNAKQLCQQKIQQRNLPMVIVDAEYQWDRRKLTFYFVAEKRIDFRELVRELFKLYKTRIWM